MARIVVAMLVGLAMPMVLFIGILTVSAPQPVREVDVHRLSAAPTTGDVIMLTSAQIASFPREIRETLRAAIWSGVATVKIDAAAEATLRAVLGRDLRTAPVVVAVESAFLLLEPHEGKGFASGVAQVRSYVAEALRR